MLVTSNNFWKKVVCFLCMISIIGSVSGCSKNLSNKEVVSVNGSKVYMDEAIWHLYLVEKNFKSDADDYSKMNEKSYWDIELEDGRTLGERIKEDTINNIIYYEILSNQAIKTGEFKVEDDGGYKAEATVMMDEINKKLKKEGMTEEGYEKVLSKVGQTSIYYDAVVQLYEVDEEKIKQDNPYDETKYANMAEYNNAIESLVIAEKEKIFNAEYEQLLEQYDIKINDKVWDKVEVGNLAKLMNSGE